MRVIPITVELRYCAGEGRDVLLYKATKARPEVLSLGLDTRDDLIAKSSQVLLRTGGENSDTLGFIYSFDLSY